MFSCLTHETMDYINKQQRMNCVFKNNNLKHYLKLKQNAHTSHFQINVDRNHFTSEKKCLLFRNKKFGINKNGLPSF